MSNTITTRAGNFTSSSIHKLIPMGNRPMTTDELAAYKLANPKSQKKNIEAGFSAAGLTYIEEKRKEIRLGRQLQQEKNPRAASWGNFCEKIVFEKLPMKYIKNRKGNRKTHLTLPWSGEEDFDRDEFVGDFKAFELNNFCTTHDAASKGWETLKEECPEIAWQLVSGSVLTGKPKAELILFVPYKAELEMIIQEAKELDDPRYRWLTFVENEDELPYLLEGRHYKNISHFEFEIPQADRAMLVGRVEEASKLLKE